MSVTTVTSSGTAQTVLGAQSVAITNYNIAIASTEYSHSLQSNLKQLIIKPRGDARLQVSFASGESGTKYVTIPKGAVLNMSDLTFSGKTLYMQANKTGIVEIMELY